MVEQWNSHDGTVWWKSGTLIMEQCDEKEEQSWWNTVVEKWNSHGGLVWWNSRTVMVEQCGGTVEH